MKLDKPTKVVNFKGIPVELFKSSYFYTVLGRKHYTFTEAEKVGIIPKPMFYEGPRRYYTAWEIRSCHDLAIRYGVPPRFTEKSKSHPFIKGLTEEWKKIHTMLENGITPRTRVNLSFDDEGDLKSFLKITLEPFGLTGDVFFENLKDEFISKKAE